LGATDNSAFDAPQGHPVSWGEVGLCFLGPVPCPQQISRSVK